MGQDISCIAPRARRSSRSSSGTTKVCDPPLLHARFQRRSYPVETPAELVEKLETAELKLHTHQVAWLEMSSATKVVLLGSCSAQYDCDDPSENYVGVFTGSWSVSGEEAMTVDLKDKAGASLRFRLRALDEGYVAVDDVESAREMAAVKEFMVVSSQLPGVNSAVAPPPSSLGEPVRSLSGGSVATDEAPTGS